MLTLWERFRFSGPVSGLLEWFDNVRYCHQNAAALTDMEYRLSCYLDHTTTGMSKAYYSKEAMYAAFDSAREEDQREYVQIFLSDCGLISEQQYYDAVGGHWIEEGRALSLTNHLITLTQVRDSLRKANNKRNAELIDGVIEELKAGIASYV